MSVPPGWLPATSLPNTCMRQSPMVAPDTPGRNRQPCLAFDTKKAEPLSPLAETGMSRLCIGSCSGTQAGLKLTVSPAALKLSLSHCTASPAFMPSVQRHHPATSSTCPPHTSFLWHTQPLSATSPPRNHFRLFSSN